MDKGLTEDKPYKIIDQFNEIKIHPQRIIQYF